MFKLKKSEFTPFTWNIINSHPEDVNFRLTIKNGCNIDTSDFFYLLESHYSNHKLLPVDIDPKKYLVLVNHQKPIAAIRFSIESSTFIFDDCIVHPMYPSNSISSAFYWMLKGFGGQLPIE